MLKRTISFYMVSLLLISILFISGSIIGFSGGAEPPVAPDAPLGLFAETEADTVFLSWEPPEYDGGDPIINYNLYRGGNVETIEFLAEVGDSTE